MRHTVAHFIDGQTHGGCEEVVLSLLRRLPSHRWRGVLYHYKSPGLESMLAQAAGAGVECVEIERPVAGRAARATLAIARQMCRDRPDILHVHLSWPLACRHAVLAARCSGATRVVATSHLHYPLDGVRWAALKWRMQDAGIERYMAVSGAVRRQLVDELGVDSSKIDVVHNGIPLDPYAGPCDPALHLSLTGGRNLPIVLTSARLHMQKGHDHLIEAAALVPNALFVLAGDGPERERLVRLRDTLGLRERIVFLGHRVDVPSLLKACDVFVLPSLYEGLPVSVLEAMAAGKPVIATRVGGTDEAIEHGQSGMLVPAADPTHLAQSINTLIADRGLARRLAAAGLARVRMQFSAAAMLRGVEATYDDVLGTSAAPRSDDLGISVKG